MKLTHIGISHFRSIGAEPVMIDLEKKVTVLVGQNDGGKSNVLLGLERVSKMREGGRQEINEIDYHKRDRNAPPLAHARAQGAENDASCLQECGPLSFSAHLGTAFDEIVGSPEVAALDWRLFAAVANLEAHMRPEPAEKAQIIKRASREILHRVRGTIPAFHKIPVSRRIMDGDQYSSEGKRIIESLASWQHPDIGQEHLREKFFQIEALLCALLSRPEAKIEVPPKHDKIIVTDMADGKTIRLPLESHGTGVHQLIIMAIAVLSQDGVMFGIEEPEIHLHPLLQKRFLKFLLDETKNRYVISTHSPALIAPSDEVEVIHLKMADGVTTPTRVETDRGSLAVLDDLGLQPSDLLQANCVIWVEGPSDRIYLKRWIEILHPALVDGIDYSIMFYGGRLLAHLSMEREDSSELGDFVKLLRINQRSALVMDSDRKNAGDELNATKQRLLAECERNAIHCWVTDGREIENYLPERVVEAALKEALQDEKQRVSPVKLRLFSKFDEVMKRAIAPHGPAWCDYSKHKTAWAHRFAKHFGGNTSDVGHMMEKRVDEMMRVLVPRPQQSAEAGGAEG